MKNLNQNQSAPKAGEMKLSDVFWSVSTLASVWYVANAVVNGVLVDFPGSEAIALGFGYVAGARAATDVVHGRILSRRPEGPSLE